MSISLQLGLAVAGGAVLAGLVAHGIWEARKNQPRKAEPDLDSAVASADEHQPTAMREAAADGATASAEQALAQPNDAQHMHPVDFAAHGMPQTQAAVKKPLDLLIDAIASIELDAGAVVSGEAALAGLPASRRVGDKPFAVEGRNVSTQEWEPPQAGQQYDAFQAGVQLANRSGALNEIGFSEFTLKAQAFADAVNGTPHFPDMIDEVARARTGSVCQRQRCPLELCAACAWRGLEHGLSASGGSRPRLCCRRFARAIGVALAPCGRPCLAESGV